jgi:diadenosine tetraphosphate (Ap4A) HIT family hydrolase
MAESALPDEKAPDCKFCYPPEPWRIIWSTPDFILQMGLGPLAEGHVLIISRTHYSCCASLPPDQSVEFEHLIHMVKSAQLNLYGKSLMFEHGRSGSCVPPGHGDDHCYHAHLHLVPIDINLAASIANDFQATVLDRWTEVRDTYTHNGRPYLLATSGDRILYAETPDGIRSRYLRRISAAALGRPELEDWVAFPSYPIVKAGRDKLSPELNRIMSEAGQDATAASTESRAL